LVVFYALCLTDSNMQPAANKFFVLGSGSFTRKLILKNAGYTFSVIKADIDERALGNRDDASRASDLVLLLANAKADAILPKISGTFLSEVLLTADQVVVYDNRILEKPSSREEARSFIEGHCRKPCSTVGSIVLTDIRSGRRVSGVDTATVFFDPIPSSIIDELLDEGEWDGPPV
jgi:septum formation protein